MNSPEVKLSLKLVLRYSLLIIAIATCFLFSPKPRSDKDYCGQYINLGSKAGFMFNCDAADYCMNAKYPSRMLGDSAIRQSRPLFILVAAAIGRPIQWITEKLNLPFLNSMGEEAAQYTGYYAGYIVINFCLILLSMLLLESIAIYISGNTISKWLIFAFQLLLVSNEITKAFFWTAHQQFFSLLTPLLTIWLAYKIAANKTTMKDIARLSFGTGVLMLLYGNFITMFGTILVVSFLTDRRLHLFHLGKNFILFLFPTFGWVAYCILQNGHYYNHEVVQYRQLVWIADTLGVSVGTFLAALVHNIVTYFKVFGEMSIFVIMALVSLAYMCGKRIERKEKQLYFEPLIITGTISILFFMILGFYEERLTYALLPVCLCIILLAISRSNGLLKNPGLYVLLAVAWHLYNVFSYGPFS